MTAAAAHRERMRPVDAAWLHMDRPTNLLVINSVWLFDERVHADRLREVFARRLVDPYPRFRQRAIESGRPGGVPSWEDDTDFDIDRHFHRRGLPSPGDQAALQALIGDLMASPLDRSKPLWDLYLIDGPGDGCAILHRTHHCIGDGISLARLALSLTDAPPAGDHGGWAEAEADGDAGGIRHAVTTLVHDGLETLSHPRRLEHLAEQLMTDASTLARLVFMPADAETSLRGTLSTARRVAWTAPIPLAKVKDIAHAQRATVNDVLLAAVAGALRRYLLRRDELPRALRAVVPFNLRPLDRPIPRELGNRFGLVFLDLPVDLSRRRERLRAVKRRMDDIKASRDGPVTYAALATVGLAPSRVERRVIDLFSTKGSAVMTNVPGPREPIYLAGVPVRSMLVWAPTSGEVGMSVSILSYRGEVTVGLMVDAHLVPDPSRIVRELESEVAALARLRPVAAIR